METTTLDREAYAERFLSRRYVYSDRHIKIDSDVLMFLKRMTALAGNRKTCMASYLSEIVREHIELHQEAIADYRRRRIAEQEVEYEKIHSRQSTFGDCKSSGLCQS